jgi:hypothetical protein
MNKFRFSKKVFCAVMALCMSVLMTIATSAASFNTIQNPDEKCKNEMKHKGGKVKHHKMFKEAVEELVEDGKISKDKAEAIKKYMEKKAEENKNNPEANVKRGSLFTELKEQKIITEEDESLIREEIQNQIDEKIEKKLEKLEDKGVLTEKNVKDIVKYYRDNRQAKKAEFEKMRGMNEEEKKAHIENMKKEMKNPFDDMVEKKIITKEQAEEIKKAFHKDGCKDKKEHKENKENKSNINNQQKPVEENKNKQ